MQRSYLSKEKAALAFEYIKMRQPSPAVRSSSETGTASILIAAELITNEFGKGLLLIANGVPRDVVILGAGTVGEFALKPLLD
jgi:alanine dehydrogenase